jgi:hypothetical protein
MGNKNTEQLFDEMRNLWEAFDADHTKFLDKGVKSAGQRARKAIGELKKLVTDYRKASVSESNN